MGTLFVDPNGRSNEHCPMGGPPKALRVTFPSNQTMLLQWARRAICALGHKLSHKLRGCNPLVAERLGPARLLKGMQTPKPCFFFTPSTSHSVLSYGQRCTFLRRPVTACYAMDDACHGMEAGKQNPMCSCPAHLTVRGSCGLAPSSFAISRHFLLFLWTVAPGSGRPLPHFVFVR